jgi:hypothetical protein
MIPATSTSRILVLLPEANRHEIGMRDRNWQCQCGKPVNATPLPVVPAVEGGLAVLPSVDALWLRAVLLVGAMVLNGVATGSYIGAALGPGPRDGLMTGLAGRYPNLSVRLVRTGIEVTVLVVGWLLGGSVGVGTVLYALAIGPLTQLFLPIFTVQYRHPGVAPDVSDPHPPAGPSPVHP